MHTTWNVLYGLMAPYIKLYSNLSTLQDHSRTKLLELWNQKQYMKNFKCHHETRQIDLFKDKQTYQDDRTKPLFLVPQGFSGINEQCTVFRGMVESECVFEVPYDKDAKNKVRSFYKHYYEMMSQFFEWADKKQNTISSDSRRIVGMVKEFTYTKYMKTV